MGIESLDQSHQKDQQQPKNSFEMIIDFTFNFQIRTQPEGQNAGRKYFLRAESDEQVTALTKELIQLSQIAADKAAARSRWRKTQRIVRTVYTSNIVQSVAAMLIIGVLLVGGTGCMLLDWILQRGLESEPSELGAGRASGRVEKEG